MTRPTSGAKPNLPLEAQSSQRARMLVTLLGPEFAKQADHPFFERLVDLAATDQPADKPSTKDQSLSKSLKILVDRLERSSDQKPQSELPTPVPSDAPAQDAQAPQKAADPKALEMAMSSLSDQHPAVIAATAKSLGSKDRARLLRSLPGATARQVLALLNREP